MQHTMTQQPLPLNPPRLRRPNCSWLAVLNTLPPAQALTIKQQLHITLTTDMATWWHILNTHATCTPDVQSLDITPVANTLGQRLRIVLTLNQGH